ncbi:protein-methionine-sulfoxide reductase catalytic subunit MsrP [Methylomonas sp. DH-1]|uniref:protein-methionine-sulfoxide reductase catalytic subunit MsrP n=1 Tax=Methylomonas sp. (strain DH-1) TaxID=1727196 RepID=UPI0007C91C07|nr:protein-methionine-sulfoxide reductase catalytic subunit MsrP [Methylomonas sp. DH-1]ANE55696.1 mononuclear molybdenum enzyme YedY [Methylomonas sp. DH-1]
MLIKTYKQIPSNEITDPAVFRQRRTLLKAMAALAIGAAGSDTVAARSRTWPDLQTGNPPAPDLQPTPAELVGNYTNYYEFAFNKEDATRLAQRLRIDAWSVTIGGEVENPASYHLEDLLQRCPLREYLYRFRCVEGWSMVVPWVGFALSDLLKLAQPLASAKFVKFTSASQPEAMPRLRQQAMLAWPYQEGLRIDEAGHPLTILAVGAYGETLPKQNGAPLRLVVPWKYGFKSAKAIVAIELCRQPPLTSWNRYAPSEYGFYANVNPAVPHPRWSQASERPLGSDFFTPRRPTELFNGYGEQVAGLYSGMNLRQFF